MNEEIKLKKKEINKTNRKIENLLEKKKLLDKQFVMKLNHLSEYQDAKELSKKMQYHESMVIQYGEMIDKINQNMLENHKELLPDVEKIEIIENKQKELYAQREVLENELEELEQNTP